MNQFMHVCMRACVTMQREDVRASVTHVYVWNICSNLGYHIHLDNC